LTKFLALFNFGVVGAVTVGIAMHASAGRWEWAAVCGFIDGLCLAFALLDLADYHRRPRP
jgi:hypothetical protein